MSVNRAVHATAAPIGRGDSVFPLAETSSGRVRARQLPVTATSVATQKRSTADRRKASSSPSFCVKYSNWPAIVGVKK